MSLIKLTESKRLSRKKIERLFKGRLFSKACRSFRIHFIVPYNAPPSLKRGIDSSPSSSEKNNLKPPSRGSSLSTRLLKVTRLICRFSKTAGLNDILASKAKCLLRMYKGGECTRQILSCPLSIISIYISNQLENGLSFSLENASIPLLP